MDLALNVIVGFETVRFGIMVSSPTRLYWKRVALFAGAKTHLAHKHHVLVSPYRVRRRLPELGKSVIVEDVFHAKDYSARQDAAAQHEEHAQERVHAQRRRLSDVRRFQRPVDAGQIAEPSVLQDVHETVVYVRGHRAGDFLLLKTP